MSGRVIVIGAGAAGLIAAGKAAERGRDVLLLEKNGQVGKKLMISGNGRCNITNIADLDGLIRNIPGNGNFLYSTFSNFSNEDIIRLFKSEGLDVKVEKDGRVFPKSDNAADVVRVLRRFAEERGAKILLNAPVDSITAEKGFVTGVRLKNGKKIKAESVVLATGGASYPGTGSTGDGYVMARKLGHTITPLKPSLVPLLAAEKWVTTLQGLSLKGVSITFKNKDGKKIYNDIGEMIFTHFGVSGPVIISGSRHIMPYDFKNVLLVIDLIPELDEAGIDEIIREDIEKFPRKQIKNCLSGLLPKKMVPVIADLSGISREKPANQLTKEERKTLAKLIKNLTLEITGSRPLSEAIVTCGGVRTDEINPSTMESKLVKGLYFAGEIIDVDGYTGGFNLTIAFSTGYTAGANC